MRHLNSLNKFFLLGRATLQKKESVLYSKMLVGTSDIYNKVGLGLILNAPPPIKPQLLQSIQSVTYSWNILYGTT